MTTHTPQHGGIAHTRALRMLALALAALLLAPLLSACGGGEDLAPDEPAPPINCADVPRPKACI